ncbi:MAG: hypothetical protein ACYDBJ_01155 [Aggregatilineales bacterium]
MSFGQIFQTLFCFVIGVIVLAGGSAVWLTIRGRPVTLGTIGSMIGGMVRWMVIDLMINMIFSAVFNSNRRRW